MNTCEQAKGKRLGIAGPQVSTLGLVLFFWPLSTRLQISIPAFGLFHKYAWAPLLGFSAQECLGTDGRIS